MAKSAETKVEDILSSVRRLVSEELPRNERAALPEGPGALVLTETQRIESNGAMRIAGRTLEERIAELEAAVGETANDDEFEPDGSEDQAVHRPDRIVYTRPPLPEEADAIQRNTLRLSQIALIDTGPDDAEQAEEELSAANDAPLQFRHEKPAESAPHANNPEPPEAPMAEDVKETLTAAEVHVFSSPDDEIDRITARLNGDPLPDPAPVVAEETREPELREDAPKPVSTVQEALVAPMPVTSGRSKVDLINQVVGAMKNKPLDPPPVPLSPPVEALLLQPEEADAAFEADLEDAVAASFAPTEEEAALETPNFEEEVPETEPAIADDTSADDTSAEDTIAEEAIEDAVVDILDEEEVRPLVARLIREELQGELGEQITRNVRKLVRREILRALAARDAE
ncbi:MAG: hypothetical protein ABJF50_14690 [Paracoccaceae bacterium]